MMSVWYLAGVHLPELSRREGDTRTIPIRGAHKESEAIMGPFTQVSFVVGQEDLSAYQVKSVKVVKCRLLTTHKGVSCCVSYTRIESCVATAYTIRYGNTKAGDGPGALEPVSTSTGLGDDVGLPISPGDGIVVLEGGGGSMALLYKLGIVEGTAGPGKAGIASSADEVSTVM